MTTPESRRWTLPSGLPPAHLLHASFRTASLIDAYGSPVPVARTAYLLYQSDALYPPEDLRLGEELLLDCGLLVEYDGHIHPTPELHVLTAAEPDEALGLLLQRAVHVLIAGHFEAGQAGPWAGDLKALAEEVLQDPERREALLLALQRKHDDSARSALGLRGEEYVVLKAREELSELGRNDLAAGVRRVSGLSDELGYDVVAPRIGGNRRLEVKTSGPGSEGLFSFFISRSEFNWGLLDPDWALVACQVAAEGGMRLVGWCRANALEPYLPVDGEGGQWVSASLEVPTTLLVPGLPAPA